MGVRSERGNGVDGQKKPNKPIDQILSTLSPTNPSNYLGTSCLPICSPTFSLVCLHNHKSIYLTTCSPACPSTWVSSHLPNICTQSFHPATSEHSHPFPCLPIYYLSSRPSIHPSTHPPTYPSIHLSFHLSIYFTYYNAHLVSWPPLLLSKIETMARTSLIEFRFGDSLPLTSFSSPWAASWVVLEWNLWKSPHSFCPWPFSHPLFPPQALSYNLTGQSPRSSKLKRTAETTKSEAFGF